jgi:4-hydroxythreonine-4-phosphate dehydrogenase
VGPELVVEALADPDLAVIADYVVTGDCDLILALAKRQGVSVKADLVHANCEKVEAGVVSAAAGRAAVESIALAVRLVLSGEAEALVTGPISKEGLQAAGYPWRGQTEILSSLCGVEDVRVMLVSERLRVVHVTAHVALESAIRLVTRQRVFRTIQLASEGLQTLGFDSPSIGVAGLNPHAGEGGLFGSEDEQEILPGVQDAVAIGINAKGPISADTLFVDAYRGDVDVVVAMYHDQGHVPVKLVGGEEVVTVTLGLPFFRTSPDHGAAHDIARTGRVRSVSFKEAVRLAAKSVTPSGNR